MPGWSGTHRGEPRWIPDPAGDDKHQAREEGTGPTAF
jgi:hypothetical protein